MMNFNTVLVSGNVCRDPELRTTPKGTSVTEVSVATNRKFGDVDETCFVDVTCWGKTAEIACEYIRKGSYVTVQGRLTQSNWQDKEGNKRSKIGITADIIQQSSIGGGKKQQDAYSQNNAPQSGQDPYGINQDHVGSDDAPF